MSDHALPLALAAENRPIIPVACGVLINAAGEIFLARRPAGKIAAGKWEFPGGKIESGESARDALARELDEELGIRVTEARPLIAFRHDYSDRSVLLDTWLVSGYDGLPEPREAQTLRWIAPASLNSLDILPTVKPIAAALRLPAHYVFTPLLTTLEKLLADLPRLPSACLLRLRRPDLNDAAYALEAKRLAGPAVDAGIGLVLDRDPRKVDALDAAGWHATSEVLAGLRERPIDAQRWFSASVHTQADLAQALRVGADCAVLGPVLETGSHPGATGLGFKAFAALVRAAGLPVYGLGGIGPAQLSEVREAGAIGVAGISAFWTDRGF